MDFSKIIPSVETVAPLVAGLLGGPLASMGVTALENVFGLTPGTTASDGGAALTTAVAGMTPETAVDLAKVNADLKEKLIQANIDVETIAAGDRASARNREVATKDWTPRVLAGAITVGFFGLLGLLAFHEVPAGSRDLLNIMLGALGTAWVSIVSYYFGSSAGSAKKDETINQIMK